MLNELPAYHVDKSIYNFGVPCTSLCFDFNFIQNSWMQRLETLIRHVMLNNNKNKMAFSDFDAILRKLYKAI